MNNNNSIKRNTELERLEIKAAANIPEAIFDLGIRYSLGNRGLQYDEYKAIDLIVRSAKMGYSPAIRWITENANNNVYIANKCLNKLQTKNDDNHNQYIKNNKYNITKYNNKERENYVINRSFSKKSEKYKNQTFSLITSEDPDRDLFSEAILLINKGKNKEGKLLMQSAALKNNYDARTWIKKEAEKGDLELIKWIENEAKKDEGWAFNWIIRRADNKFSRSINWIINNAYNSEFQSAFKYESLMWVLDNANLNYEASFDCILFNAEYDNKDCIEWINNEVNKNNPLALRWLFENPDDNNRLVFDIIKKRSSKGDEKSISWMIKKACISKEAFDCMKKNAEMGNLKCINWMISEAKNGNADAFYWLRSQADIGNPKLSAEVGKIYVTGNNLVPQSFSFADKYLSNIISNDPTIIFYQGLIHADDVPDESIHKICIAAASGERNATQWLIDNIKDISKFKIIAHYYDKKSECSLIFNFIMKKAIDGDPDAISFIKSNAKSGDKPSLNILGNLYATGKGLPYSKEKAISCYKKVSTPDSFYKIAELMRTSEDSIEDALEYYYKAASSGHKEAWLRLNKYSESIPEAIYLMARIFERDNYTKAREMMTKASKLGCKNATDWLNRDNKDNKRKPDHNNWNDISY